MDTTVDYKQYSISQTHSTAAALPGRAYLSTGALLTIGGFLKPGLSQKGGSNWYLVPGRVV